MPQYIVICLLMLSIAAIIYLPFGLTSLSNYFGLGTLQSMDNSNSGNTSREMADSVTSMTIAPVTLPAKDYDDVNNFDSLPTAPNSSASNLYLAIEKANDSGKFEYNGKNLTHIKPDAFLKKKNLRVLNIRSNPLVIDPGQIWIRHSGIVVLDISDSNLSALNPIVFKGLPKLKLLIMSGNPGCDETREKALLAGAQFKVTINYFRVCCEVYLGCGLLLSSLVENKFYKWEEQTVQWKREQENGVLLY